MQTKLPTNFDDEIRKLIEANAIAEDQLTKEQLVSAFKQALESGDFLRLCSIRGTQQVIYLPYRAQEQQEAEKAKLKRKLNFCIQRLKEIAEGYGIMLHDPAKARFTLAQLTEMDEENPPI